MFKITQRPIPNRLKTKMHDKTFTVSLKQQLFRVIATEMILILSELVGIGVMEARRSGEG